MRTKICPVCDTENPINALVCTHCGATLSSLDTMQVSVVSPEPVYQTQLERIARAYSDSIVMFVDGREQPIIIPKRTGKITLGRSVSGQEPPTVDLMEYGAGMHGVSRLHACIYPSDHGYMLQDLESTNGTWLNSSRLIPNAPSPVQDGDRVRLGDMSLFVFFGSQQAGSEQTLILYDPVIRQHGVTTAYLINEVGGLLESLTRLQQLIDEYEGTEHQAATISGFAVSRSQQSISVDVENLGRAINAWIEIILPWKRENMSLIERRSLELEDAQLELSCQIIDTFDQDEEAMLAPRLLPIIDALMSSPLDG